MEGTMIKRLIRRPWLSLTGFLVGGALCLLLCMLTLHIDREQAHLADVRNSYEIRAVVSDVRGTKTDRLFMSYRYTNFLKDEINGLGAYVRDLQLTKSFDMSAPFGTGMAIGVTNERCADALNPKAGGAWYAETEGFFESSERICLVSEVYYEAYAEQEVSLVLTDGYAMGEGKGEYPFKVAGWYKGEGTNVFLPYPTSQSIAGQLAEAPSSDSACFIVKDNDRIDEMLAVAGTMFQKVDPGEGQGRAFALTVHDRQFKATIASMEQNIRRTSYLFPLIALMTLCVGFTLGILGTRRELKTYALMRSLGVGRFRLFASVLAEQMLMPLLAAGVTAAVLGRPLPALLFAACHFVGCVFAVLRPVAVSPTKLFREQE